MSRDDDPNNDLPQQGNPFQRRDDSPYDDLGPYEGEPLTWRRVVTVILIIAIVVVLAVILLGGGPKKAKAQGYLPPDRYTRQDAPRRQYVAPAPEADPLEYYAEDWVVLNQSEKLVCRDPYIMRDLKVIRCVGNDPVR